MDVYSTRKPAKGGLSERSSTSVSLFPLLRGSHLLTQQLSKIDLILSSIAGLNSNWHSDSYAIDSLAKVGGKLKRSQEFEKFAVFLIYQ